MHIIQCDGFVQRFLHYYHNLLRCYPNEAFAEVSEHGGLFTGKVVIKAENIGI